MIRQMSRLPTPPEITGRQSGPEKTASMAPISKEEEPI